MEIRIVNFDTNPYYEFLKLRADVFCNEQSIDYALECDEYEADCRYFLVVEDDKVLSGARLRKTSNGYKIERLATRKEERGKGYASLIINTIVKYVNKEKLYLHAQIQTVSFYLKLGFTVTGNSFEEANILHQKMIYSIVN